MLTYSCDGKVAEINKWINKRMDGIMELIDVLQIIKDNSTVRILDNEDNVLEFYNCFNKYNHLQYDSPYYDFVVIEISNHHGVIEIIVD